MHQHVLAPSIEEEAFHNSLEIVKEFPKDPVLLPVELDKWDTESEKELLLCLISERLERADLDDIILRFRNFTPEAIEAKIREFLQQKADAQRSFNYSVLRTQSEAVRYMLASRPKADCVPRSTVTGGPFHIQAVPCPEAWKSRRVFSAPFQVETMRQMIRAGDEQGFSSAHPPLSRPPGGRGISFRRPRKVGESGEVKRITASDLTKMSQMLLYGDSQEGMRLGEANEGISEAAIEDGKTLMMEKDFGTGAAGSRVPTCAKIG